MKWSRMITVVVGLALLALVACGSGELPEPTDAPSELAVATTEPTVAPTETSPPTATTAPTATAEPTETPTAAPTEVPTMTPRPTQTPTPAPNLTAAEIAARLAALDTLVPIPMYRGNLQHTGVYSATGVPGPATLAWQFVSGGEVHSSPA
ncbi:MAG: hypothetical protein KDE28_21040, partial [Anaerolineales bacterium]|nr:hypothetical protein [Anaerolineales bacterium]